jgi:hypothetical protein
VFLKGDPLRRREMGGSYRIIQIQDRLKIGGIVMNPQNQPEIWNMLARLSGPWDLILSRLGSNGA